MKKRKRTSRKKYWEAVLVPEVKSLSSEQLKKLVYLPGAFSGGKYERYTFSKT